MVLKVKEPIAEEYHRMREGQVLFTYLHLAADKPLTEELIDRKVTGIAYETVQLPSGGLPLLYPMSEVAGCLAPQVGAHALLKAQGGRGVLLGGVGGVANAKVVIIGAGVSGQNAANIALGMGADVTLLDTDLDKLRMSFWRYNNRVHGLASSKLAIEQQVTEADMVIGAVLIPGAAAPKLVSNELVSRMKPGSVLVDIAVDQGGCFEDTHPTTHADPTYAVHNSIFYCVANMPGAVPNTSTYALTNATMPYAVALANKGWEQACRDDHSLALGLNTHAGQLTNKPVGEAVGIEAVALDEVLADADRSAPVTARRGDRAGGPHLSRPPGGRARPGGEHPVVVPPRPAPLPRAPRRAGRRATSTTSPRRRCPASWSRLREGDADHPPLSATSAARTVVAVRGFHKFALADGLATADPAGGGEAADAGQAAAQGAAARRRRGDPRGRRVAPAPRSRCATGRCSRCSTAPARGSRRRSGSTSTTSTPSTRRCCCAARAARSGSSRSAPTRWRRWTPTWSGAGPSWSPTGKGTPRAVPQRPRRSAVPAVAPGRSWSRPPSGPGSPRTSRRTRCGTRSPPTCSTAAPTSASSRSCSATPPSPRRRSTRWSPSTACARCSPRAHPRARGLMMPASRSRPGTTPDDVYAAVVDWAAEQGLELYPHQDEAVIELLGGSNVVLATPTGSGKSLVAVAAHAAALARDQVTYYTAPIKALVSEKFFELCEVFGAEDVGMLTGDASVNTDAPVICCTAEILANIALREGRQADVGLVVMDEFHFYAEPDRGWAWQVPLLELPEAQFLLMSATLGDVSELAEDLSRRTGRETVLVTDAERPVPLTFTWALTPLAETLEELVTTHQAPVYVVHFTQAAAVEHANSLLTQRRTSSKPTRRRSRERLAGVRFSAGFGKTLSKLLRGGSASTTPGCCRATAAWWSSSPRPGCSPSSAAPTPSASASTSRSGPCCSPACPSTTAAASACSAPGSSSRSPAGRAGRASTRPATSSSRRPSTSSRTRRRRPRPTRRTPRNAKKKSKAQLRKPAEGEVVWTEQTFDRLVAGVPEPLVSRMRVDNAMLVNVLAREEDAFPVLRRLLTENHSEPREQRRLARRALRLARGLLRSGILTRLDEPDRFGRRYVLTVDLPDDFALNQELAHFALAALDVLDPEAESYTLDVVSVIEAVLEPPRQMLLAQQHEARGEAIAAMKADGIEYDERMALLEEVTWPRPLAELLEATYELYRESHPWLDPEALAPKAVVREMWEQGMGFTDFVARYQLARSEGLVLRYLTDAYRTLRQTVPETHRSPELEELIEWLGETVRQTDSSLLDEWEALADPAHVRAEWPTTPPPPPRPISLQARPFRVMVRNAVWRRVELAARDDVDGAGRARGRLRRAGRAAPRGGDDPRGLGRRPRGLLRRPRRDRPGRGCPGAVAVRRSPSPAAPGRSARPCTTPPATTTGSSTPPSTSTPPTPPVRRWCWRRRCVSSEAPSRLRTRSSLGDVADVEVTNNEAEKRYEARVDGELAGLGVLRRRRRPDRLHPHRGLRRLRGARRGVGAGAGALDDVRADGRRKVLARCPFIKELDRPAPGLPGPRRLAEVRAAALSTDSAQAGLPCVSAAGRSHTSSTDST